MKNFKVNGMHKCGICKCAIICPIIKETRKLIDGTSKTMKKALRKINHRCDPFLEPEIINIEVSCEIYNKVNKNEKNEE